MHHDATPEFVTGLLQGLRLPLQDEKRTQSEMSAAFMDAGLRHEREWRLGRDVAGGPAGTLDIPDFFFPDTGLVVEVKIKGAKRAIHDQCARYCLHPEVRSLVLATAVATGFPSHIHGKPCRVASLGRGALVTGSGRGPAVGVDLPTTGDDAHAPGDDGAGGQVRTYGTLHLDATEGRWILGTAETHIAIRLKQIFPRLRKTDTSPFSFPADDVHATELEWFMVRYPLRMQVGDRRLLRAGRRRNSRDMAEVGRILSPGWSPAPPRGLREGRVVRDYQAQAVDLTMLMGSLLLGDDVGLGKTYAAIALALREGTLPMAVVCYPHLQRQWAEKIAEMCHLDTHLMTTTKAYTLPDVPIVLFRYSNILGWTDVFKSGRFRSAVWDEIQELRTGTGTEKGRASKALAETTSYQLGLSATPIFNLGDEIYDVLGFLPGKRNGHVLGTPQEFTREWMSGGRGVKDPDALGMYLREHHAFLRRTKGDVGQQMDRVTSMVIETPYDPAEERKIEDLARTLAIRTLTGAFMERGQAARDLDILMRQTTGVAKAKGVAQFVRLLVESGQQVLLSGWHREYYRIILAEIADLSPAMYTGTESPTAKDRAKREFVSGKARVLVISNRSGAGLDGIQQVCSTVVIGELDWSPEVHHQIIGRADREGQTLPVTAYYMVCDDGSDPPMVEALGIKSSQIRGIVDPNRTFPRQEGDEGKLVSLAKHWLVRHGHAADIPEPDIGKAA